MFTQLDPKDPTREFSFVLKVDKHDKYEVYDCKPSVDASTLLDVEETLNQEDDYVYLARTMREFTPGINPGLPHTSLVSDFSSLL